MFGNGNSEIPQILRVGVVSSVDEKKGTARVRFEDRDDIVSHDLKIIVPQTMKNKYYHIPDIDESVLCAFLQNGIETGFILGAYYNNMDTVPVANKNIKGIYFEDGTNIQYNLDTKELLIDAIDTITIKAKKVNILEK